MGRHKILRPKDAVSPQEVAERFGCDAETVKVWIRRGRLKAAKARNGYWWIREQDLAKFLKEEVEPKFEFHGKQKGVDNA